jgi:hypothetical protein
MGHRFAPVAALAFALVAVPDATAVSDTSG